MNRNIYIAIIFFSALVILNIVYEYKIKDTPRAVYPNILIESVADNEEKAFVNENIAITTTTIKTTTTTSNDLKVLQPNEKIDKIKQFYYDIAGSELQVFSQNKEDGVIRKLAQLINKTYEGYYIEFGTEDGKQCNTRYLRESFKWTGLLMDGMNENLAINLHKEKIMHSNILDLFTKYNVTDNIDLLSEDTDYADYWIVEKILTKYHPKVLIHEINQQQTCVTVPKPETLTFWEQFSSYRMCNFYLVPWFFVGLDFN